MDDLSALLEVFRTLQKWRDEAEKDSEEGEAKAALH
jgi:hypothetical protein